MFNLEYYVKCMERYQYIPNNEELMKRCEAQEAAIDFLLDYLKVEIMCQARPDGKIHFTIHPHSEALKTVKSKSP